MKRIILIAFCFFAFFSYAQRVADPVTLQGIGANLNYGATGRALAGTQVSYSLDGSDFLLNPALLTQLKTYKVKVGGGFTSRQYEMKQDWIPNRLYAELSIIFENEQTFVTKAFDDLKPDWERDKNYLLPTYAAITAPFEIAGFEFAAGAAFTEAQNLDHYFRNNNALDPNIGQMRPAPIPRVVQGDSLKMKWFSYENERIGSIYSYTGALAFKILPELSVGVSGTYYYGTSDDRDFRSDRGIFMLGYSNLMRLDSAFYTSSAKGESKFSGTQFTIGGNYKSDWYAVGASVTLPVKLKREWNMSRSSNDGITIKDTSMSGEETLESPLSSVIGITFYPTNNLAVTLNYLLRNSNASKYTTSEDTTSNPYLSNNTFSAGLDYRLMKWMRVRLGYRDDTQRFAPEGAGIIDEPVHGSLYTAGLGFTYEKFQLDLAYEYNLIEYQDAWLSNINYHKRAIHALTVELGYSF